MNEARTVGDLEPLLDYGFGTFTDEQGRQHPLVISTMTGRRYHLNDHGGSLSGVTWTEEFAREGLRLPLCKQCRPSAPDNTTPPTTADKT